MTDNTKVNLNEERAREIVAKCSIPPDICSNGSCLVANAYLAAIAGPEMKAKDAEIIELKAWRDGNKGVSDYYAIKADLQAERERSKALVDALEKAECLYHIKLDPTCWRCGLLQALAAYRKAVKP